MTDLERRRRAPLRTLALCKGFRYTVDGHLDGLAKFVEMEHDAFSIALCCQLAVSTVDLFPEVDSLTVDLCLMLQIGIIL